MPTNSHSSDRSCLVTSSSRCVSPNRRSPSVQDQYRWQRQNKKIALDQIHYKLLIISSREVQNVWKFHTFRSGSSLSVHDSHAFQRTPGPASLSRAESVHSVSWRNHSFRPQSTQGNILRFINIVCKCSLTVYCEVWSGERTSWAIFQRNISKVIMEKQQIESLLNPSAICMERLFFCCCQFLDGFANLCIDDDAQVPSN